MYFVSPSLQSPRNLLIAPTTLSTSFVWITCRMILRQQLETLLRQESCVLRTQSPLIADMISSQHESVPIPWKYSMSHSGVKAQAWHTDRVQCSSRALRVQQVGATRIFTPEFSPTPDTERYQRIVYGGVVVGISMYATRKAQMKKNIAEERVRA